MEIAASVGTELALSGLYRVLNKLASNFGGDVTLDEMEHLNVFVRYEIEALIREAKSDDLLKLAPLLEKLQAAALELEDLLDLYEYNQIEKQVISSSSSNPIIKFVSKSKDKLRPVLPKSDLRRRVEKLLKFIEQVEKIHPFIMSRRGTTQLQANTVIPKTSTLSSPFYGRGDQCDKIIKLLLDESHADLNSRTKNVPIIAIRGLGGAGKTTTAQHLYNEKRIEKYFNQRMWVQVTRGFDERALIKEIIECTLENECPRFSSLDRLHKELKTTVSEKKFLLVLDDVWEEDTARLDTVLSPLNQVGVKGSRIIVTTRTEKAAKDLNAKPIILLDELMDEDCWSILKHHAFDDNDETVEGLDELKYVGNQIISKVKHSPLALKVVGSSLRNKRSANEWEKILQQEDILKDTMDLLLFSYQCLPLHLQQCFAYCSLFPKGYRFDFRVQSWEPHLISLWISQGFIENTSELTLEEAGKKYIEELLSYSFFEKKWKDNPNCFFIHDLLHDLAVKVSKNQCCRIEPHHDSLRVPTTCIHLSLCIAGDVESIDVSTIMENLPQSTILAISDMFNLRNLRSLIILSLVDSIIVYKIRNDIFQKLTKLRALSYHLGLLSDPRIDKLKHLRYLHVQHVGKLPTSLAKLYHLQFFILTTSMVDSGKYLSADTLPQGFGNLFNLRTLNFHHHINFRKLDYLYYNSEMINIEKLKSLQNLNFFYPDGFNGIISLRNLSLGGSLSILNLENVKCKEEAEEAMLNKKKNLKILSFKWSSTPNSINTCKEILEGLEPHRNLEELNIKGYQGVRFSNWMIKENWLPRLKTLRLKSCKSLKIVPFLPPCLHELYVHGCDELMQLPPFGDTLRDLFLSNCPKLSLTVARLSINNCPKLTSLRNLQCCTSLKNLGIFKCPMLKIDEASLVEGVIEGDIANRLPDVERIKTDAPLLVLELVQQQAFSSIERLTIEDCAAIPNLEMLSSLRILDIHNCPDVESLPKLPVALQKLKVFECPKLKKMHEEGGPLHLDLKGLPNLQALTNLGPTLTYLSIVNCPKLTSLGNLQRFTSLKKLAIYNCPMLRREEASLVDGVVEGDIANRLPHVERIKTDEPLLVLDLVQQQAFSSIKFLYISALPKNLVFLASLQDLGISSKKLKKMHEEGGPLHLELKGCTALSNLDKLSSLLELTIFHCPAIELLPNLPVSLQLISISGCPKLKEKYEEGGPVHNTISHIPKIDISD